MSRTKKKKKKKTSNKKMIKKNSYAAMKQLENESEYIIFKNTLKNKTRDQRKDTKLKEDMAMQQYETVKEKNKAIIEVKSTLKIAQEIKIAGKHIKDMEVIIEKCRQGI